MLCEDYNFMNGWQKSTWAKVIASGLLIATLNSCNGDEPAANVGTPASGNMGNSSDTAPIASSINTNSTAPSSESSTAPSTEASKASTTKEAAKETTPKEETTAKKSIPDSKLVKPSIAPDVPLPPADIVAKPAPAKSVAEQGGLSKSQIDTMKTTLDEAKKLADGGKLKEAVEKYNEFAGGSWDEAVKDPKAKGNAKFEAIATAVKVADEAAKGTDVTKLAKAIADVSAAVAKAK
jgi:hypothetical protein